MKKKDILPIIYIVLFLILSVITGWNPADRISWFLEFLMVFILMLVLIFTRNIFRFSNTSYTLMFLFSLFPIIGGHYNFESVPMPAFLNMIEGGRNAFDRFLHFYFGIAFAIPIFEYVKAKHKLKGFFLYFIPVAFIFAGSAFYEIIEWLATLIFNHESASDFIATQGDVWDAQKDMMLAGISSILTMLGVFWNEKCHAKKDKYKNTKVKKVKK